MTRLRAYTDVRQPTAGEAASTRTRARLCVPQGVAAYQGMLTLLLFMSLRGASACLRRAETFEHTGIMMDLSTST